MSNFKRNLIFYTIIAISLEAFSKSAQAALVYAGGACGPIDLNEQLQFDSTQRLYGYVAQIICDAVETGSVPKGSE